MSTQYPMSPKVQLGGIAHLGRIIARFGSDLYLLDFLVLDTSAFERRVRASTLPHITTWADMIELDETPL